MEFCHAASELHYQLAIADSVLSSRHSIGPNEAAELEKALKIAAEVRMAIPFAEIYSENWSD